MQRNRRVASYFILDRIAFECNLPLTVESGDIPPSRLAIREIQISFCINLEFNQNEVIIRSIPFDTIHSMKCLRTLQSLYFIYPGEYITLYQTQRTALKSYYKDREKLIAQLSSEKANMQVSNKITLVIFSDVMRCSIVEVEKSTDCFRKCSKTCKPLWNIA